MVVMGQVAIKAKRAFKLFASVALPTSMVVMFNNCTGFQADPNMGLDRAKFFSTHAVFSVDGGVEGNVVAEGRSGGSNLPGLPKDGEATTGDGVPSGATSSTGGTSGTSGTGGFALPNWVPGGTSGTSSGTASGTRPGGFPSPSGVSEGGGVPGSNGNVSFLCSYGLSNSSGMNLMRAKREGKSLYVGYRNSASALACATQINIDDLIATKTVVPPNCPEASDLNFALEITTTTAALTSESESGRSNLQWTKGSSAVVSVLYALNDQIQQIPSGFTQADFGDQSKCDMKASPLIIQMAEFPQRLVLTSPVAGILFDIFGANALPTPHSKQPISWLVPESRQDNYFVVLPNSSGSVNGIDELFGDNTMGPDGKFAANGYEALRKHDGKNKIGNIDPLALDGIIDSKDAIFTKLRLWNDLNGDGTSQSNELHTLSAMGIKSIDLNYDPNYAETDEYGNETRYKSIVNMENGSVRLIYDLWFNMKGS